MYVTSAVNSTSLVIQAALVGFGLPLPDACASAINSFCIAVCGEPDKPSADIAAEKVASLFFGCSKAAYELLFGENVQLPAATAGA